MNAGVDADKMKKTGAESEWVTSCWIVFPLWLQNAASTCRPSVYPQTVYAQCRPVKGEINTDVGACVMCLTPKLLAALHIRCHVVRVSAPFTWVKATHSITSTLAQDQNETFHRLFSRRIRSRASKARNTVCTCRLHSKRLCRESMDSWGQREESHSCYVFSCFRLTPKKNGAIHCGLGFGGMTQNN